jgi:aminopeptidase N
VWNIPVCVKTPEAKVSCDVVGAAPAAIPLDSCPAWVMANAGARGYYRVVNPPAMVKAIADDVEVLTPAERIAVVADEWALVQAGRHDVGTFLDLAAGFKGERSPAVMGTLLDALKSIDQELTTESSRPKYRAWLAALLRPALQETGWSPSPGESEETKALRALLVEGLGNTARDPEVITKARELVLSELAKPGSVEPTLLNTAVTVAAHGGDAALYEKYLAGIRSASDPEEHYRYMYALAAFSDPALVRRTMEYILGPEVRNQDAKLFIARLIGNVDARPLGWQLLRERWNDVQKKTGEFVGNTVIVGALGSFCDTRTLAQVKQFFAVHKVPDAERTLQQAIERINACVTRSATQSAKLAAWLTR